MVKTTGEIRNMKVMNTGLQIVGVTSYLKARQDSFVSDTVDLVSLIDSTLTLTENCKNIAVQLGIPLETPADRYRRSVLMMKGE